MPATSSPPHMTSSSATSSEAPPAAPSRRTACSSSAPTRARFCTTNLVVARGGFSDLDQSASFSHTYNFRPTLLNSFIFSYNRINGTIVSGAPFSFADLGIPIAHSTPPELVVSVSGYFSIGTGHPGHFNRQNFHFSDSLHWIRGRHEIAIGGDFMKMQVDLINTFRHKGNFRFRAETSSGE